MNSKHPSWTPYDSTRLNPSPTNKKFHLAIVGEIGPRGTLLDNCGFTNRQGR